MPNHPVKFFSSQHTGLASMPIAAGSLISVLDACLINGFNVQSLTSLAIVDNELIGSKNAHGYVVDQVIVVSGANEAALNTEWRLFEVSTNGFKASATGMANVTGTGTITAKVAPAGWVKPFSGTNLAAYKSVAAGATGCLLRVDDTNANNSRVVGYESMTDVDTGVGPFPTSAQAPGGGYWSKTISANMKWLLIATDKAFFFINERRAEHLGRYGVVYFGDFESERLGDAYACALECAPEGENFDGNHLWSMFGRSGFSSTGQISRFAARSFNQIGSAITLLNSHVSGIDSGHRDADVPYPSGASNGIVLLPITAREQGSKTYRCLAWPGVMATPQAQPLSNGFVIRGVADGRDYLTVEVGYAGVVSGRLFFDLTGPW